MSAVILVGGCGDLGNREATAGTVATKMLTAVAAKDGATAVYRPRPGHRR